MKISNLNLQKNTQNSEEFSQSANETYEYLTGLQERTWTPYGLFEFNHRTGFI